MSREFASKVAKEDLIWDSKTEVSNFRPLSASQRQMLLEKLRSGTNEAKSFEEEAEIAELGLAPLGDFDQVGGEVPALQRKARRPSALQELPDSIITVLERRIRGRLGNPLAGKELYYAQEFFGNNLDFGSVRIHMDEQVDSLCTLLNAIAFTYKEHVFLSSSVDLSSDLGRSLLLHELVHVKQHAGKMGHVRMQAKIPKTVDFKHSVIVNFHEHPFSVQVQVVGFGNDQVGISLYLVPLTQSHGFAFGTSKAYTRFTLRMDKKAVASKILLQSALLMATYPEGISASAEHSETRNYTNFYITFEGQPFIFVQEHLEEAGEAFPGGKTHSFRIDYNSINKNIFPLQEEGNPDGKFTIWPIGNVETNLRGNTIWEFSPDALAKVDAQKVFVDRLAELEQAERLVLPSFSKHTVSNPKMYIGGSILALKALGGDLKGLEMQSDSRKLDVLSDLGPAERKKAALVVNWLFKNTLDKVVRIAGLERLVYGANQGAPNAARQYLFKAKSAYLHALARGLKAIEDADIQVATDLVAEGDANRIAGESLAIAESVAVHGQLKQILGKQCIQIMKGIKGYQSSTHGIPGWRSIGYTESHNSLLSDEVTRFAEDVREGNLAGLKEEPGEVGSGASSVLGQLDMDARDELNKKLLRGISGLQLKVAKHSIGLTTLFHYEILDYYRRELGQDEEHGSWVDAGFAKVAGGGDTIRMLNQYHAYLEGEILGNQAREEKGNLGADGQLMALEKSMQPIALFSSPSYQKLLRKLQGLKATVTGLERTFEMIAEMGILIASMAVTAGASAVVVGGLRALGTAERIISLVSIGVEAFTFTASSQFFHLALGKESGKSFFEEFKENLVLFTVTAGVGAIFSKVSTRVFKGQVEALEALKAAKSSGNAARIAKAELNLASEESRFSYQAFQGAATGTNMLAGHFVMELAAELQGHPMDWGDRAHSAATVLVMHLVGGIIHKHINAEIFQQHFLQEIYMANGNEAAIQKAMRARVRLDRMLEIKKEPDLKDAQVLMKEVNMLMALEPRMETFLSKLEGEKQAQYSKALQRYRASMQEIHLQLAMMGANLKEGNAAFWSEGEGKVVYKSERQAEVERYLKDAEKNGAKVEAFTDGYFILELEGRFIRLRPEGAEVKANGADKVVKDPMEFGETQANSRRSPMLDIAAYVHEVEVKGLSLRSLRNAIEFEAVLRAKAKERFEAYSAEDFALVFAMMKENVPTKPVFRDGKHWHSFGDVARSILNLPMEMAGNALAWLDAKMTWFKATFQKLPAWARAALIGSAVVGLGTAMFNQSHAMDIGGMNAHLEVSMAGIGVPTLVRLAPGEKLVMEYTGNSPAKDFLPLAQTFKLLHQNSTFADFQAWAGKQEAFSGFDFSKRESAWKIAEAASKHSTEVIFQLNEWSLELYEGLYNGNRADGELEFLLKNADEQTLQFFAEVDASIKFEGAVPDVGTEAELSWNRLRGELVKENLKEATTPEELLENWHRLVEEFQLSEKRTMYDEALKADPVAARQQLQKWLAEIGRNTKSSEPVPDGFFQMDPFERHMAALRSVNRSAHVEAILSGRIKLPENIVNGIRAALKNPGLSQGKRMLNRIGDAVNKEINNVVGRELANIPDAAKQSEAFRNIIENWPLHDLWVISERLIEFDKRLQGEMYGEGVVTMVPQVKIDLSYFEGRFQDFREADFLVGITFEGGAATIFLGILDVKTGYETAPVDMKQKSDYFLAVSRFMEGNERMLGEAISQELGKKGISLDNFRVELGEVAWLYMPGKASSSTMSGREAAVRDFESMVGKGVANPSIPYKVFYYEMGLIKRVE